jgi:Uma2 family endonuclease
LHVIPAVDGRLRPDLRSLLGCEVLSPGSSRHDRITKRRAFQQNEIPEYWIIDGDAEAFEIWHPHNDRPSIVDDRIVWQLPGSTSAFELDVKRFFADIASDSPLPSA